MLPQGTNVVQSRYRKRVPGFSRAPNDNGNERAKEMLRPFGQLQKEIGFSAASFGVIGIIGIVMLVGIVLISVDNESRNYSVTQTRSQAGNRAFKIRDDALQSKNDRLNEESSDSSRLNIRPVSKTSPEKEVTADDYAKQVREKWNKRREEARLNRNKQMIEAKIAQAKANADENNANQDSKKAADQFASVEEAKADEKEIAKKIVKEAAALKLLEEDVAKKKIEEAAAKKKAEEDEALLAAAAKIVQDRQAEEQAKKDETDKQESVQKIDILSEAKSFAAKAAATAADIQSAANKEFDVASDSNSAGDRSELQQQLADIQKQLDELAKSRNP